MINKIIGGWSAKSRIALGQTGLMITLLVAAWLIGLIPNRDGAIREGRAAVAEVVAINTSIFITRSDLRRMEANLRAVAERNSELLSAAVKRRDGKYVARIGDHEAHWDQLEDSFSTDSQLIVPILERQNRWGQLELRFQPLQPEGWVGLLYYPGVQLFAFLAILSFFVFQLYLGKMLKHLDPSQAIPDRVRSALDTMAEGLLVIDARQNICLANEAFASIVNKPSSDLLGKRVSAFPWISADGSPFNEKETPWNHALQHNAPQMGKMIRLQLENAESKTFMINCSPVISGNGKASGVLISFDDVTELEEKELELRKSKDEAEAANRAKSDFLANMSHEIRTPMNAILGFAEVLKRGYAKSKENNTKYLDTIVSSGTHLLNLINDILDLSKVEAGRVEVEKMPCALHRIVQEVVQVMEVRALEKNIYLEYSPEGPLPERILTDPVRLRQIMTNLIGNSIKFTEQGGVTIVTRLCEDGAEPTATIEVRDTGIGMTKKQADSIFEAFVQADSSITRRFGGTGLGLTISKRFAQAMGGDILVRSEVGEGSTFSTIIPTGPLDGIDTLEPSEILAQEKELQPSEKIRWSFPSRRVLVVDDGNENRELLKVVLEDAGLQVETAENGRLGYDKASGGSFDMILMDVEMPEMDGYTAVGLIRNRGLQTPVIALTAHAMKGTEEKCLSAGYSDYMTKPIDIDLLMERLAKDLDGWPSNPVENQATPDNVPDRAVADRITSAEASPIRSSLPMDNPRFREIVDKFVPRLKGQLESMEHAWREKDLDELAKLAHWLKGSAGSVGFSCFTEPAREIERAAKGQQPGLIPLYLAELDALYRRIELQESTVVSSDENEDRAGTKSYSIPDTVRSRLPDTHPKFRPIIQKFVERLAEQMVAIESSLDAGDFDELANLAHWLKGSGGSVGFNQFTEPARDLEEYAKTHQEVLARHALAAIRDLQKRIVISGQCAGQDQEAIRHAEL